MGKSEKDVRPMIGVTDTEKQKSSNLEGDNDLAPNLAFTFAKEGRGYTD
jgi:hypothetical protein